MSEDLKSAVTSLENLLPVGPVKEGSAVGHVCIGRFSCDYVCVFGCRKNKRLFEVSSLHLLLQEMHRTADRSQAFLNINLSSILLNLGLLTRS